MLLLAAKALDRCPGGKSTSNAEHVRFGAQFSGLLLGGSAKFTRKRPLTIAKDCRRIEDDTLAIHQVMPSKPLGSSFEGSKCRGPGNKRPA